MFAGIKISLTGLVLVFLFSKGQAQESSFAGFENLFKQPLSYVIYKTTDSLKIDGKSLENGEPILIEGIRYELSLEAMTSQYSASIKNLTTGESWQISQSGIVSRKLGSKSYRP